MRRWLAAAAALWMLTPAQVAAHGDEGRGGKGHTHEASPRKGHRHDARGGKAHRHEGSGDPDHAAPAKPVAAPPRAAALSQPAPHGGVLVEAGAGRVEVVFGSERLEVWLFDDQLQPLAPAQPGTVKLVVGAELRKAPLAVEGGRLVAPLGTPARGKAVAVVLARMNDTPLSLRVERPDPATALPYHDHRALHGGLVMMSADDHAELVAEPGGIYKLWYSDAWRKPHRTGVSGTLTIETDDGRKEVVPLEGPTGPDGLLQGKGAPSDGRKRTVRLEGKVGALPFVTYWVFEPIRKIGAAPVELEVTEAGFVPANLEVKAGQPVTLRITRRTDSTCARDIEIPGLLPRTDLPMGTPVEVTFTPPKAGRLRYGCSMDQMIGGVIVVQ